MKRLTYLALAIVFFVGTAITFDACKEEEEPNQSPTCEITSPTNGQEVVKGETVTISVDANDSDGNIVEVRFFIDEVGKSSANSFPYNYEWNTSSENIGNHIIKATSIDNIGSSTSDEIVVTIIDNGGGIPPTANFTANITSGNAPLTVTFLDQSLNNPTTWLWDFGDGGTSTQQNPSHTYNADDSYTVTLTVTNNYGSDVEPKPDYIVVSGGGETFTDPRDGQTYDIVDIGSQTWMAENLNYETENSWCYDDDGSNCDVYGRLYTWNAAMNGEASSNEVPSGVQGVCPPGWHLPSDEEWKILEMYLGMSQSEADDTGWRGTDEGGKMKESGTAHWLSPNTGATNSSGFSALPGGFRNTGVDFYGLGGHGNWWSATEYDSSNAWYRGLYYNHAEVSRNYANEGRGFSVRCVRD